MQALEQALLTTNAAKTCEGLFHHSDRGTQYVSLAYTDALITAVVEAFVGTTGDSYDNALAETVNGLYKTELIYARRWSDVKTVEIATMGWVSWWNNQRLNEALGHRPLIEIETTYNQTQALTRA